MKFGFFDDGQREYVIQTPETPYPWINYLGNEKFFSLIVIINRTLDETSTFSKAK